MMNAEQLWAERVRGEALFATGSCNLTWRQALECVARLSQYLSCQTVRRAGLYFDDAAHFAIALLACVQAGIDVSLPANMSDDNCRWLEQNVDVFLTDEISNDVAIVRMPVAEWNRLPDAELGYDFSKNIAIILQTSGSTGKAKFICKDWQSLCLEAKMVAITLPRSAIAAQPVMLGSVSVQHMYGLSFRIMLSLYLGWPIYRQRLVFPEVLLATSRALKKVIWISSPTLLQALQLSHNVSSMQDNVVAIVSAGGVLAQVNKSFLCKHVCPYVVDIYGSTETGAVAYRVDQCYWQFFPDIKYESGENGLLILSDRCVEAQILADEIIEHKDGFELLGRLDRIIKLADKRISLVQLENQLMAHEWVTDIYIIKHPEASHLAAWVALSEEGILGWRQYGRKVVIRRLRDYLLASQEKIALPRYWRFTSHLPRNEQSKLRLADVQQAVLQPITEPIVLDSQLINADEYQLKLRVPLDLLYFNGHFDGFHLVPGVIQIKWILDLLKQYKWLVHTPYQMENLKFQHFLRPNDVVDMVFRRDNFRQKISFECRIGVKKISSGRLVIPAKVDNLG